MPGKLWLATTGVGASPHVVNLSTRERERAPFVGVPVRQVDELGGGELFFADRTPNSASLRGKLRRVRGEPIAGAPALGSFRDAVYMAQDELWARVEADGRLVLKSKAGETWALGGERVGDRIVLTDLDDDETFELVTTRASHDGEADELMIRRVDVVSKRLVSSFRRSTDGAITALAVGRFHSDDGPAVWFIEQSTSEVATVWRVVMR